MLLHFIFSLSGSRVRQINRKFYEFQSHLVTKFDLKFLIFGRKVANFCYSEDANLVVDRKGSLSAFWPKESDSKTAETFRPKMIFRPKGHFQQKWYIYIIMVYNGRNSFFRQNFGMISANFFTERMIFLPKLPYFGRNMILSASFGPFGYFRFVSAFGRNSSFQNALFRFRPKLLRSISTQT